MEQGLEISDPSLSFEPTQASALADPGANPFKLVVDPVMRAKLRRALLHLIESHDAQLAAYVSEDKLALESYKEYIELFAKSLRETMESVEGVQFLMKSCGFSVETNAINLDPEWRWKSEGTMPS